MNCGRKSRSPHAPARKSRARKVSPRRVAPQGDPAATGGLIPAPATMSKAAKTVWKNEIAPRLLIGGLACNDTSTLVSYCEIQAIQNRMYRTGEVNVALFVERRRLAEVIGLIGDQARASGGDRSNKFWVNDRHNRPVMEAEARARALAKAASSDPAGPPNGHLNGKGEPQ